MQKRIIAQSSLTYAYKGESILRASGIAVQIVRLAAGQTIGGCGYGLSIFETDLNRALGQLRSRGAFIGQIL